MDSGPKICCFDIESTGLDGDWNNILCVSWKWVGKPKVHTVAVTDYPSFQSRPWEDKALVRDAASALSEADMWVTWYGERFDERMINTRLLHYGLPPLPKIPHWDGWRAAKDNLKMSSNRLANIARFLNLDPKTPLEPDIWIRARYGERRAIRYVVKHCEQDVLTLEQAYQRLRPLPNKHVNVTLITGVEQGCPRCGSDHLQRRGEMFTVSNVYQRYQCRGCGHWCRSRRPAVKSRSMVR